LNEPHKPVRSIRVRNLTDLGNAERLIDQHGRDLRYCATWKKWLIWDGQRWRADDTNAVISHASRTVRSIYAEATSQADPEHRKALSKFAARSEGAKSIENMVTLARPMQAVRHEDLDTNPWLLNVSNGTIDLRNGKLRPHRREDLITKLAPVEFDPRAKCPTWMRFLQRITSGRRQLLSFLCRAVGYALTGDVSEQVVFFLHGSGANGKTTFATTLQHLLGDYAQQAAPELLVAKSHATHPTDQADLFGCRLAVCSEMEQNRALNEVLTKQLTGGDRIKARRMREDFWEFEPTHKIFLITNHKPNVRGTDHAIWRRIRLIPFTVTIPKNEQDPKLPRKLRQELPGILAWAVRGCLEWRRFRLREPKEVREATATYQNEMDVVRRYVEECCIEEKTSFVVASEIYAAYLSWSQLNGEESVRRTGFGARLDELGFKAAKGAKGVRLWRGIRLRPEWVAQVAQPPVSSLKNETKETNRNRRHPRHPRGAP